MKRQVPLLCIYNCKKRHAEARSQVSISAKNRGKRQVNENTQIKNSLIHRSLDKKTHIYAIAALDVALMGSGISSVRANRCQVVFFLNVNTDSDGSRSAAVTITYLAIFKHLY